MSSWAGAPGPVEAGSLWRPADQMGWLVVLESDARTTRLAGTVCGEVTISTDALRRWWVKGDAHENGR